MTTTPARVALALLLAAAGASAGPGPASNPGALHAAVRRGDARLVWQLASLAALEERDGEGRTPLIVAAAAGNAPIVALLIDAGSDVNAAGRGGAIALHEAVRWPAVVDLLLAAGADPMARASGGRTVLMWNWPSAEVAAKLLRAGHAIDARDDMGRTALMAASSQGQSRLVAGLLALGAPHDSVDELGHTALSLARQEFHTETAEVLCAAGAVDVEPSPELADPALRFAAGALASGEHHLVLGLAEAGVDLARKDGFTSLVHATVSSGDVEALGALLEAAPSIALDRPDGLGRTPLEIAVASGRLPMVQFLSRRVRLDLPRARSHGAVDMAVEREDITMALLLLEAGAATSPYTQQTVYRHDTAALLPTLLERAAPEARSAWSAGAALQAGARHCARYLLRRFPGSIDLVSAARSGDEEIVRMLLSHGAGPGGHPPHGPLPLHTAAALGHASIVAALIEAGADVEELDHVGMTALMTAAAAGSLPVAERLIAAGADLDRRSAAGVSAWELARRHGRRELADLLAGAGASTSTYVGALLRGLARDVLLLAIVWGAMFQLVVAPVRLAQDAALGFVLGLAAALAPVTLQALAIAGGSDDVAEAIDPGYQWLAEPALAPVLAACIALHAAATIVAAKVAGRLPIRLSVILVLSLLVGAGDWATRHGAIPLLDLGVLTGLPLLAAALLLEARHGQVDVAQTHPRLALLALAVLASLLSLDAAFRLLAPGTAGTIWSQGG